MRLIALAAAAGLTLGSLASGQNPPEKKPSADPAQTAGELAGALTRRLSDNLHVKTAVGKPVTVGSVTLIPILMIDVSFGGAGLAAPGTPQGPGMGGDGFLMSGEARPLGFVVVTRKGTRFLSVAKPPAR
jgi:uncharacterized spore protein YtfJ